MVRRVERLDSGTNVLPAFGDPRLQPPERVGFTSQPSPLHPKVPILQDRISQFTGRECGTRDADLHESERKSSSERVARLALTRVCSRAMSNNVRASPTTLAAARCTRGFFQDRPRVGHLVVLRQDLRFLSESQIGDVTIVALIGLQPLRIDKQ